MKCRMLLPILAALLLATSAAVAQEPPLAAVVVRFGDGRSIVRVVSLASGEDRGMDVLRAADLGLVAQNDALVCKIGPQGCDYPQERCVCGRAYWGYWHHDGERWVFSNQGAASHVLAPGDIDGWAWGNGQAPDPLDPAAVYDERRLAPGLVRVVASGPAIMVTVDAQGDTDSDASLSARLRPEDGPWQPAVQLTRQGRGYAGRVASDLLHSAYEIAFEATDPDGVRGSDRWTAPFALDGDSAPRLPLIIREALR